MRAKLDLPSIEAELGKLTGWELSPDKKRIFKAFKFDSFNSAFAFMTRTAQIAEKIDHHPDWSNSYNKVKISLTTHSAGGLTKLDFELANHIESIANS